MIGKRLGCTKEREGNDCPGPNPIFSDRGLSRRIGTMGKGRQEPPEIFHPRTRRQVRNTVILLPTSRGRGCFHMDRAPLARDAASATRAEISEAAVLGRMARDLSAFFKLASRINSIQDPGPLQREVLQLVCEVVPAEQAACLLTRGASDEVVSVTEWRRRSSDPQAIEIDERIVGEALRDRSPVLAETISGTVLCVPLISSEEPVGAMYLVATGSSELFGHDHRNFASGISGIAAVAIQNALRFRALEAENELLHQELGDEPNLIGESPLMREIKKVIARVAGSDSTVLIRGESGTGKELVARAVHRLSPRAHRPFLAINCAALTETLLESEMFGYEKGAFTGAVAQTKGKFEAADGGTVLLDEVGELSPTLQAKLLRVLQEREFQRVGGTKPIKVDVRILAATNRKLEEAIEENAFRQDLYYRLNVVALTMPALRERRDDIKALTDHFVARYAAKCNRRVHGVSPQALKLLQSYGWPGNIRELENAIERAIVLGTTDLILTEDLPETVLESQDSEPSGSSYQDEVNRMKKELILQALESSAGSFTQAAKALGLHPNYLHRLVRKLGIRGQMAS